MTTQEKLIKNLTDNGLSVIQGQEIMETAKPVIQSLVSDYTITWDRPSSEYPEVMYNLWYSTLKQEALKWIIKNKPQAWFRPMFE